MNFLIFGAFWYRTLGNVGHSVMEYVILSLTLFYSPILYNLLAFYFLDSIAFYYTYSNSIVYNLSFTKSLYISL